MLKIPKTIPSEMQYVLDHINLHIARREVNDINITTTCITPKMTCLKDEEIYIVYHHRLLATFQ